LDYQDGIVVAAGAYRLNHPGFNSFGCDVKHTVCHLEGDILSETQSIRSSPLFFNHLSVLSSFLKRVILRQNQFSSSAVARQRLVMSQRQLHSTI
jgi:hypothetical protein